MRALLASLLLLVTTAVFAQTVLAQTLPGETSRGFGQDSAPEFLPVDEAYQLAIEVPDATHVRAYWQITPAYYLYQHAFKFVLESDGEAITLEPAYPEAIQRFDDFFGEVHVYYNDADVLLRAQRDIPAGARLSVTYQGCADAGLCYPPETKHFTLDPASGEATAVAPAPRKASAGGERTAAPTPPAAGVGALPYMLLLAFLGGAILNLMPCVFPILSLKVLSFARASDHNRHLHSWVYTAGVVASFVAVAAVLIALQQAGRAVGWGFQLQSPGFVIALAYLFLAMGLSLSGLVQLGGSLMNAGSTLANRGGLAGSFFTGVLAVVVASPCTAPFMGTALGFAVTQPPLVGLSVFAALGLGMAAPLLLFGYSGAARSLMPAPGPWMETLKQFLAFPLYAAAVWLLWVAGRQTGVNTMAAALAGALALSLALWLWSLGGWRRALAVASAVLAIGLGSLHELDPRQDGDARGKTAWSEQTLAELRAAGQPVFVDVTADWCITCLANERAVLLTDEVDAAFERHGVAYLVADWTNYDPAIARYIAGYGRTGIPLYLMYPADPDAEPLILPQILTRATVLSALESISNTSGEFGGNIAANN
ncbi:protein-disulfide reductase DsbD [Mangrovimicrobium sediminis]|uniref:Protein-disulfide reductase DsbD n=1 Tax=Mangrovimicrobium sediminis TaxID=2562682 RepID=A0A4Z0LYK4_9GAMM|nr:protein-disulfide reductase DsbD [Haliea sp. SAOS-164]TGD72453.1 protein-disulfide reductase DsbD [Haliea sp. SAOS-164]